jgi:DNA invertase Pin-like site-specific DNA recombinase
MSAQGLRAGIYARISDDRDGDGLGVRRQVEDCRKLADLKGWEVVEVYTDDSVSAYSGKQRPAYQRLLEDVADGRLDVVACWHGDRLHRSTRELLDFADTVAKAGARVETVQGGGLDLSTPSGRAVATTLAAWAEHESAHKAQRNRRKALELAQAGKVSGGGTRPFGYEADRVTVRQDEATVVRDLMARALAGAGPTTLANRLNRDGITTTTGGPWHGHVVRRVLTSARISGWREHRGEWASPAVWPGIVDRTQVEQLRAAWQPPSRYDTSGPQARRHLLTGGVTVCGNCGHSLLSRPHTNGTPSLVCARAPGRPNCGRLRVQHEPLEALVVDMLLTALASPDLAERIAVATGPEAADLVAEVRQLEDDLAELAAMHGRRELARAEWMAAREPMSADLGRARKALTRRTRTAALDGIEGLDVAALRQRWDGLDLTARAAILSAVVERVEVGPAVRGRNRFAPDRVRVVWRA